MFILAGEWAGYNKINIKYIFMIKKKKNTFPKTKFLCHYLCTYDSIHVHINFIIVKKIIPFLMFSFQVRKMASGMPPTTNYSERKKQFSY